GAWWILSGILASLIGGLAAGRLCGSTDRNTAGWHGLLSWCVTTLVVAYLVTSAVGGLVGGTVSALGSTIGAVGRGAASAVTGVAQTGDADALQARVRQLVKPDDAQSVQDAVLAYVRARLNDNGAAADAARERAVTGLARAANVSPDEARSRLDKMVEQARDTAAKAAQKAQAAAEAARQAAATAGIFGFAALVLGAVAGWFGGRFGVPRTDIPRPLSAMRTR
ncbi:MAG: hypothetical protein J0H57_27405, partial [Rhodospirillales bacterium]|nr:hypothetical protein [Rhodospirillales bacterium]